jgi:hypothetical protein
MYLIVVLRAGQTEDWYQAGRVYISMCAVTNASANMGLLVYLAVPLTFQQQQQQVHVEHTLDLSPPFRLTTPLGTTCAR